MSGKNSVLVKLSDVSKVFRSDTVETHALVGVSLDVYEGEYLALTGRSGSGKSTMLAIIGLLDTLSSGKYELAGRAVERLQRAERARLRCQHIGFVFQFFHLIGDLTIAENIGLPMVYAGKSAREIDARVDFLAERLQIGHRLSHRPHQLSGGQQQRVAVARALANDPDLLLVDEPTGNLDQDSGAQVMALLAQLHAEGRTILLVSHDPQCTADATRRLEMRDGALVTSEVGDSK